MSMKLTRIALFIASTFLLASTLSVPANAANIKKGDVCSPIGATFKQKNSNFICTKKGSSAVWEIVKKSASPTPTITYFTMPNVIGMNLQLAQDLLQSKGSYLVDQEDALGLNRFQLVDSNWKVCRQSPKSGGKTATSAIVTLSAVKLTERCP